MRTPKKKTKKKRKGKKGGKKKPLDKGSSTSSSSNANASDPGEFTVQSVLESFANPRCDLFTRSLQAELDKHPELADLKPSDVEHNPPKILFSSRRKGYFKAPHLCRVWALDIIGKSRIRGEFFVVWVNNKGEKYDGRSYLAHMFVVDYLNTHEPSLSVTFHKSGALKSTSHIIDNIRRYAHPENTYMSNHI